MVGASRRPRILLAASDRALSEIEEALGRSADLRRWVTVRWRPVPARRLRRRLARLRPVDGVILTSPAAVESFLAPVLPHVWPSDWRRIRYWASGPATARALRRRGGPRATVGAPDGAEGIFRALARSPPLRLLYPRSDRAGPALARRLRRAGHRVVEVIAYRHRPAHRASDRDRRWARGADLIVVTSPSAWEGLRRALGPAGVEALRSSARWVALGPTTARSLRTAGLRVRVVAPGSSAQRFTPFLLGRAVHVRR
ncbi:MAG: uroporphyrinogen-III synthase [Thermoplasmata archaeon]